MSAALAIYSPRDSAMARIEALFAKHAPRLIRTGGGGLRREAICRPVTDAERAQMIELAKAGMRDKDIAAKLGRTPTTVSTNLRRAGIKSWRALAAVEHRAKMPALMAAGWTCAEIAAELGISVSTAWHLRAEVRRQMEAAK